MVRRSAPASSRWVAKQCRKVWGWMFFSCGSTPKETVDFFPGEQTGTP